MQHEANEKRSNLSDNDNQIEAKPTSKAQHRIEIPHLDPLPAIRLQVQIFLQAPLSKYEKNKKK